MSEALLRRQIMSESFRIGDRVVGPESSAYVIAEAGSNHNGEFDTALSLVDSAVDAGADAVKFQTFRAESLYTRDSGEVEYLQDERDIYEIIESMEMPYDWIPRLADYCSDQGITFLSTPFDEASADELAPHVPAYKVASYTLSHHPFLRYLAKKDRPIILSTGAHSLSEVSEAVEVLREENADFALLHCVAAYPTPLDDINVSVVKTLKEMFGVVTGLSDHTMEPVIAPTAAVALGGRIIEKHFTLDRSMDGPDHGYALEPDELTEMVSSVHDTRRALGSPRKQILDVEDELHRVARRAIHATADISAGTEFSRANIGVLRPGKQQPGLPPKHLEEVLGQKATRDIEADEGINWEDTDIDHERKSTDDKEEN